MCIGKEMSTGIFIQEEAVAGGPIQDFWTTASNDGDVECFDLYLLQDLHAVIERGGGRSESYELRLRMSFTEETLQCPCTALLDLEWY
jgi:hypothetical protein